MIPDDVAVKALWDTYHLPPQKRIHCQLVADVSHIFVWAFQKKGVHVDESLVVAAALLHDVDKNIPRRPGERHPDTAVRILGENGMNEVARIVKTHPLHAILDPAIAPYTIEQKIVYLSDKMVKHEFIGTEERFRLWRAEEMDKETRHTLEAAYPKVKEFENELMERAGLTEDRIRLALEGKT